MLALIETGAVLASVAFAAFWVLIVGQVVYSWLRAGDATKKIESARRLAQQGQSQVALDLLREAKTLLPSGKHGSATPAFVEVVTLEAALEERLRNERIARAAKAAEPASVPAPAPAGVAVAAPEMPAVRVAAEGARPGMRVGEYVLEERIGEGGFGQVWRARHAAFRTAAAVKIPNRIDGAAIECLGRLARIQRRLDDPRVVRVLGADLDADPPYVAMELVDGMDLRRALEVMGHLEPGHALGILDVVLGALAVAHGAGITHRDLKPENILVAKDGAVKLTDFELGGVGPQGGQAQLSTGLASTISEGAAGGTLAYMAPEQLAGEAVDARADVYAIGVILFEMLTGKRPHPGDLPSQFRDGLPPVCDALFQRCYTRLERRFPSAREALAALREGVLATASAPAREGASAPAREAGLELTARRS